MNTQTHQEIYESLPTISIPDTYPNISFFDLFRFATKEDKKCIFLALMCSGLAGVTIQMNSLCFGSLFQSMVEYGHSTNPTSARIDAFLSAIWRFALCVSIVGVVLFVLVFGATTFISSAALNQVKTLRQEYFKAIMIQDIEFFEVNGTGDFASRLMEDVAKIEDGIGEKFTSFAYYQVSCISSVILAICRGWKLALMCVITFPCMVILVGLAGWVAIKYAVKECEASGHASSVAQETFRYVRTVYAFSGQKKEVIRYNNYLIKAYIYTERKAFYIALAMGTLYICIYLTYALTIRYGYKLIKTEPESYNVGNTLTIFLGLVSGSSNFRASLILMDVFGAARGAGAHLFELIDRKPNVHPFVKEGQVIASPKGTIEFNNVSFAYPSRSQFMVLKDISIKLHQNKAAAFVGNSGCGKSTLLHMICRYYDVINGSVRLDGVDVRDLSVEWLRGRIGHVFTDMAIFNATVRENIRYGCENSTDEEVQTAAEKAFAHDFIMKLPKGYDTELGEGAATLSGGQRQRIAIARALIRKPLILLLDEATSQVDRISEDRLQRAIFEVKRNCTVIIVASLLSSIQYADIIHVMVDGKVVESGTHNQLTQLKGHYYHMIAFHAPPKAQIREDFFYKEPSDWQINALSKLNEKVHDFYTYNEDDENVKDSEIDDDDDNKDRDADQVKDDGDPDADPDNPELQTIYKSDDYDGGKGDDIPQIPETLKQEKPYEASFFEVLRLSFPEWRTLTLATFCSFLNGLGIPILSLIVASFMKTLYSNIPESTVNEYSVLLLGLSVMVGLSNFTSVFLVMTAGNRLTRRLKRMMFAKLLEQDIAYFDDRKNDSFALCARLSGKPLFAREVTGIRMGSIIQTLGTVSVGITLSFYYDKRVALFGVVFFPLMVLLFIEQGRMIANESLKTSLMMAASLNIAIEAVYNIRTINALGREKYVISLFEAELDKVLQSAKKSSRYRGVINGLTRGMVNFVYALGVLYGGYIIVNNDMDYEVILKATQSLLMGITSVGVVFMHAPSMTRGINAASFILTLLNSRPKIRDPIKPIMKNYLATGRASLKKVQFEYPTQQESILNELNLEIQYGKTTAVVGINGNGKSTIIRLLERFYDPSSGTVSFDGIPLPYLRVDDVRRNIGLVGQECSLFHYRTIAENIAYGDNTKRLTLGEIKSFAKQANIHHFIKSLPDGYNSKIGMKGALLSGGQKQRIAIARALIREPALLILDEATSALDMESEKLVQESFQKARQGRTCLMVSHRLHTLQDADVIAVLHGGRIAEMGTFDQLSQANGIFRALKYLENRHLLK